MQDKRNDEKPRALSLIELLDAFLVDILVSDVKPSEKPSEKSDRNKPGRQRGESAWVQI